MQPKLVRHVGGLVNLIIGLREQLQRAGFGVVEIHRGPSIACFCKATLENFHDAVCIRMAAVRQYGNGYDTALWRS
jgi:hypothetical protein